MTICVKISGKFLSGKGILIWCDNSSSVSVLNSGKARSRFMQSFLREVCFYAAIGEFEVRGHVAGEQNRIPDHLSRWHLDDKHGRQFFHLTEDIEVMEDRGGPEIFDFSRDW